MTVAAGARAVVVVDDDADHARIVSLVVTQLSPAVTVTLLQPDGYADATDLADALADVPAGALVLLDRKLGRFEAVRVLECLSASGSRALESLQVVVMSAALTETERVAALEAGASAALEKPANLDGWRALLRRLLAGSGEPLRAASMLGSGEASSVRRPAGGAWGL